MPTSGPIDADTGHDELVTGVSPWGNHIRRPPLARLDSSFKTDVVVVGAGITGAFAAEHLTARGLSVCVIDREQPGLGSTHASTAMLQWEIDRSLQELTGFYGFDRAAAIYQRSLSAVAGIKALIEREDLPCAFRPRSTVYLSGDESNARELLAEFELRQRAGLPGAYLEHHDLGLRFGLDREAAIVSPGSAEADPLLLCWALLDRAGRRGARMLQANAIAFHDEGKNVVVETDGDFVIEARHIVLATGYAMPHFILPKLHTTASSWALATVPQKAEDLWPEQALIWEASDPYLYARTTADNRIIVGGEDEDIFDPDERDAKLPEKVETIVAKLRALWPQANPTVAHSWCGAFGQTSDGLPLIGRVPGAPRILGAYGYGGNGITFSFMAAQMMGAFVAGENLAWFDDFALDRDDPTG